MSTEFPSKSAIARTWLVVDAEDVVLGKLASKAAKILMGKHKASYTPFLCLLYTSLSLQEGGLAKSRVVRDRKIVRRDFASQDLKLQVAKLDVSAKRGC